MRPNNQRLQLMLMGMLSSCGRYSDATALLKKYLRKHPNDVQGIARLADVFERTGQLDEALEAIKPVMSEVGRDPRLSTTYAKLKVRAKQPQEAVDALLKLTQTGPMPTTLFRVLAKAYEALGDVDNAFYWHISANQLPPNPNGMQRFVDHIAELIHEFTAERVRAIPRARHGSQLPILIAARPRSGTTLVESILDAHPDAAGGGEFPMLNVIVADAPLLIESTKPFPQCFRDLSADDADRLGRKYLDAAAPIVGNRVRFIDKNLANFRFLGIVQAILPGSKVLHCRRNEVDNCFGIFTEDLRLHFYASDLRQIGITHRLYQYVMKHWHEVLDLPILDLDYEELVSDQEGWTRRILEFSGLPWDDRCLRFYEKRNSEKQNVKIAPTLSYDQVRKPMYKTSVGRAEKYKKHLGPLFAGFEEGDRIVKAIDAGETPQVE
jgi:hypothetical protein